MKIVITGSTGFIGKGLCKLISSYGHEVVQVSRKPLDGYFFVEDYRETPEGDVLIHLGELSNRSQVNKLGIDYQNNAVQLAKDLAVRGYKKIIYGSSVALYGDRSRDHHSPFSHLVLDDNYSQTKHRVEQVLLDSANTIVLRLSNIYGPNMNSGTVFSTIFEQYHNKEKLKIQDDAPIRDFLYVDDVHSSIIRAIYSGVYGIYNIASGESISISDLLNIFIKVANLPSGYSVVNAHNQFSCQLIDISKTISELSWMPKVDLECGLIKCIESSKLNE